MLLWAKAAFALDYDLARLDLADGICQDKDKRMSGVSSSFHAK